MAIDAPSSFDNSLRPDLRDCRLWVSKGIHLGIDKAKVFHCAEETRFFGLNPQTKPTNGIQSPQPEKDFGIRSFLFYAKGLYAAALGIEILSIAATEIGENTGLYLFGFNAGGIAIAYVMGYALASFTTFITILSRYANKHTCDEGNGKQGIDSCCSVLEQDSTQRFVCLML